MIMHSSTSSLRMPSKDDCAPTSHPNAIGYALSDIHYVNV